MNNDIIADKDQPIEAVLVKRRQGERNDLVLRDHVVLKNGPRTYKVATHWAVISPGTDQLRHEAVRIEAYKKCKAGWTCDDARSIRLEYIDEVRLLGTFLGAINNASIPNAVTDYLIVPYLIKKSGGQVYWGQ